jgi:uncharacterized protein YjbJ (UPF0337 family)
MTSTEGFGPRADQAIGAAEEVIGEATNQPKTKINGQIRQAKGKAEEGVETAKKALSDAADQAAATISKAADQASTLYSTLIDRAQSVSDTVDPFVNERPYAAAAIAAIAGLVLGALFFGRGAKVIYVRTPPR